MSAPHHQKKRGLPKDDHDYDDDDDEEETRSPRKKKVAVEDGRQDNTAAVLAPDIFCVPTIIDTVMLYLDLESLYKFVRCGSKSVSQRLTYRHAIFASLLPVPWTAARPCNIRDLFERLIPQRRHFIPSPFRVLQLAIGRRCERCNNGNGLDNEPLRICDSWGVFSFGVCACDACLENNEDDDSFWSSSGGGGSLNKDHDSFVTTIEYGRKKQSGRIHSYLLGDNPDSEEDDGPDPEEYHIFGRPKNRFVLSFFPDIAPYGGLRISYMCGHPVRCTEGRMSVPTHEKVWKEPYVKVSGEHCGPIVSLKDIEDAMHSGKSVDKLKAELDAKDVYAVHVADMTRLYAEANEMHKDRRKRQKEALQSTMKHLLSMVERPYAGLLDYKWKESEEWGSQVVIELPNLPPGGNDILDGIVRDPLSVSKDEIPKMAMDLIERYGSYGYGSFS